MTVPTDAQRNWCPACGDTCEDHGCRICTACGTELQYPCVSRPQQQQQQQQTSQLSVEDLLDIPGSLLSSRRRDPLQRAQEFLHVLQQMQQQQEQFQLHNIAVVQRLQQTLEAVTRFEETMEAARQLFQQAFDGTGTTDVETLRERIGELLEQRAQDMPEVAQHFRDLRYLQQLLQQEQSLAAGGGVSRPTSSLYLSRIPRVVLEPRSSILYHGTIKLWKKKSQSVGASSSTTSCLEFTAILGEFGGISTSTTVVLEDCRVVIASPRTGKGGVLSEKTCQQIQNTDDDNGNIGRQDEENAKQKESSSPVVVYFDRGGDVTFVGKALLAQKAGAHAVIIGNNLSEAWPYTMKDSKSEATKYGLRIPVVMVKQADALAISSHAAACGNNNDYNLRCRLEIQPNPLECAVCLQALEVGQTVLSLPACGHVFHDSCSMTWLHSHNTCPNCRQELPTDDEEEYEE